MDTCYTSARLAIFYQDLFGSLWPTGHLAVVYVWKNKYLVCIDKRGGILMSLTAGEFGQNSVPFNRVKESKCTLVGCGLYFWITFI